MPKHLIKAGGQPLLDIASYARSGIGQRDRLSPAEVEVIRRTVSGVPEVMVKVLNRGASSQKAVRGHFAYLNRSGALAIETDDGESLIGKSAAEQLLEEWDLDIEERRQRAQLLPGKDRAPPRLIHKVLSSMPPGTPPEKALQAVRNFAREAFAPQHRPSAFCDIPNSHGYAARDAGADNAWLGCGE